MRRLLNDTTIGILALILPIAALANVTGTPTLSSGQTLSLDTGTVGSSGGDILFTGSSITFQGSATGLNVTSLSGLSGSSGLSTVTTAISGNTSVLSELSAEFSAAPISGSALSATTIIGVHTNGGNYSAVLIQSVSGTSLSVQFVTLVVAAPTVPTITQVLNNYSLIPAGFVNSGISPGTLFIIKGALLSNTPDFVLQNAVTGLQTTLNGATVNVTVNGTTTHPPFYYAGATQLALVLPSNTPLGNGTVTVSYNGQTSASFPIQVVASSFGFAAAYGTGSGTAHAQDLSYNSYSYTNSVAPGATIRLIGSGLGADPTRDTQYVLPSAASAINALAHVYIGGIDSTIFYQGPEGYPGVDEVDVTVPANAPTGCYISLVGVSTTGVTTNFVTLPIGTGVCQDPGLGTNGTQITSSVSAGQTTVNSGFVEMFYSTSPATGSLRHGAPAAVKSVVLRPDAAATQVTTGAIASFQSTTASGYGSGSGIVSIGACIVSESISSTTGGTSTTTGLNAGTITVTGPNAAPVTLMSGSSFPPGYYEAQLPAGFLTASGGTFQFQATAGTQVGAFTTQVVFPEPLLQWTNQTAAATVTRSAGLPITWSGGSPGTYVIISGSSSSASASGFFTCLAPVAAEQFTVPSYVLATLPASTIGELSVANETVPTSFTATGLNYGEAIGYVSYDINAAFQ
jgi:uncharacterized protein (TIGR03437 family)